MRPSDPIALAQALIRCPSVTPAEGGALTLVGDVLVAAGFATERMPFSAPGTPDVENLYARMGVGDPCLVFAGHTDVVPPGAMDAWTVDPFGGETRGGRLFGRGAADMKGAVAASVAAVLQHLAEYGPPAGSIAFILTGDEEGPAVNGTAKIVAALQARGARFHGCVLGEPTNPDAMGAMIKIGRRGSLSGDIIVRGRQGHVAYPDLAQNPIDALFRVMSALKGQPLDAGTAAFLPSNLEFTSVDVGNAARNIIPDAARAAFNVRFNDLWTSATLADELGRRIAAINEPMVCELTVLPTNAEAFLTKPGPFVAHLMAAVVAETGRTPALSTTGGTSDARFLRQLCPVAEFGLVGRTMHQIDEHVDVADILTLTRIYRRVIERFFAST